MIKALIFDMDGLLFDSERVVQRSWNIVGKEMGYEQFGDHIYNTIGLNIDGRREYFQKSVKADFPMEDFSQRTRDVFYEIEGSEGIPLKPGACELIDFAKNKGYKLAVASSSRRVHGINLLKKTGIKDCFDTQIYGDMVTRAKPDPEIFLTACASLEIKLEEAIVLEDSPNGIKAAHLAGALPVMIPDLVVPSAEVKAMCAGIYNSLFGLVSTLS